jgi:hypothetical protein
MNIQNEILENLFIGNKESSEVNSDKFYLVVNCSKDIPFSPHCNKGIRISINDDPSEVNTLLHCMINSNILEEIHMCRMENRPVLVHCFAGMQRSCAVVACYLIKYYNALPQEAVDYIKKKRVVAFFGGVNFMKTLHMFNALKK